VFALSTYQKWSSSSEGDFFNQTNQFPPHIHEIARNTPPKGKHQVFSIPNLLNKQAKTWKLSNAINTSGTGSSTDGRSCTRDIYDPYVFVVDGWESEPGQCPQHTHCPPLILGTQVTSVLIKPRTPRHRFSSTQPACPLSL
jgi:hypothetical protein